MPRLRRTRRLYYRRSFLNRPGHHAGAYVLANLTLDVDPAYGRSIDAEFAIADCGRVTHLDFGIDDRSTAAQRRNALHKARVLRDVVVAFTEAFEAAVESEQLIAAEAAASKAAGRAQRRASGSAQGTSGG